MLRLALASYLSFALLAGPAFCCCAAARLAERIVAEILPSRAGDHSPTCPHCCKSPRSTDSDRDAPPPTDCPDHCPCQQDRMDVVLQPDSGMDSIRLFEAGFQNAVNPLMIGHHDNAAADCASDTGFRIVQNTFTLHCASIARLLSSLQLLLC